MNWRNIILNTCLRLMEKPYLARVKSVSRLRRFADLKARLWFRPPKGSTYHETKFAGPGGDIPLVWTALKQTPIAPVLLYFHGGGYVFGSARTHRALLAHLAQSCGAIGCLPMYRLAPEHPFPAAFDDARAAYQHLLDTGVAASRIIVGGDSAGGGLALALLAELLRENMPLPVGVFALSPLTDMTFSGASVTKNRRADVMLPAERAREMAGVYLGEGSPDDPRASPLFADFTGAPPIFLAVGITEILQDDTLRLEQVLTEIGVQTEMDFRQNVPHVWPLFQGFIPEAQATLRRIGEWAKPLLTTKADS